MSARSVGLKKQGEYGSLGDNGEAREGRLVHWEHGNSLYVGKDPCSPEVGDYRVSYSVALPGTFSVLGGQSGETVGGYAMTDIEEPALPCLCSAVCCCGAQCVNATSGVLDAAVETGLMEQNDADRVDWAPSTISTLRAIVPGQLSAPEILSMLSKRNSAKTTLFRGVGYLLMLFGFYLVVQPIPTLFSVVGFLGELTGWALFILCALLACAGSCTTIGMAWFFYRPLVTAILLGVLLLVWYFGVNYLSHHVDDKSHVH
eukprot:TRINITY_DN21164_c0_g1_i2.p1 TRINITY_DN21164_c0_g1~~TRINITY_DN21164_c0_g1_i2.p1  ORF type:complete len:259 (-),score=41.26 TRINITY_DN21164_c0_g1_i2:395-1171(-)